MNFEKPKNIFIVDDDPMTSMALKEHLSSQADHKISIFRTGEEALHHLDEKPDVVILDLYLNAIHKDAATGLEILEIIKSNYPDIHVIMLSSQEKYSLAAQTIQKGAEQYVIKDETAFEKIAAMMKEF